MCAFVAFVRAWHVGAAAGWAFEHVRVRRKAANYFIQIPRYLDNWRHLAPSAILQAYLVMKPVNFGQAFFLMYSKVLSLRNQPLETQCWNLLQFLAGYWKLAGWLGGLQKPMLCAVGAFFFVRRRRNFEFTHTQEFNPFRTETQRG